MCVRHALACEWRRGRVHPTPQCPVWFRPWLRPQCTTATPHCNTPCRIRALPPAPRARNCHDTQSACDGLVTPAAADLADFAVVLAPGSGLDRRPRGRGEVKQLRSARRRAARPPRLLLLRRLGGIGIGGLPLRPRRFLRLGFSIFVGFVVGRCSWLAVGLRLRLAFGPRGGGLCWRRANPRYVLRTNPGGVVRLRLDRERHLPVRSSETPDTSISKSSALTRTARWDVPFRRA